MSDAPLPPPPLMASALRMALRIVFILAVIFAVTKLSGWVMAQTKNPEGLSMTGVGIIVLILLAYAALISVPFVPGIEIGVGLMLVQGAQIAPFVYLATVLGLLIAYMTGWLISYERLHRFFADFRMRRACHMLERIAPLSPQERLSLLADRLPRWLAPMMTKYRYLTLALAINLPGNWLLGGGGGIGLLAGITRLFTPAATTATLFVAVAPVPLLIWITGSPLTWFVG